jgi:hypothetical protein
VIKRRAWFIQPQEFALEIIVHQIRNLVIALLTLVVGSTWLIGCGTAGAPLFSQPTPFPTIAPTALPTTTPTALPTFTPTRVPSPTNTPLPSATFAPTLTLTPTPRPLPTFAPPPGWKKLESAQLELWAPGSFVGGDPIKEKDAILRTLRAWGPEYQSLYKSVEQNPTAFALYAIDSQLGSTGFVTAISVTANQIVSTSTGDTLQGGVRLQLPLQFTALDRRNVMLDYYYAERMVTDSPAQGIRMRQLVYTIKSLNTAWVVAFSTAENEFFPRLSTFEQSILTLRFKP